MNTESLSYKTMKNAAYSFISYAWPILFSIFVTPLLVYKLGVGQFGLYILLVTITGFAGLIDLGYSSSLLKYVSEYSAVGNTKSLKNIIYSSNTMLLFIGLVFILIFVSCGWLIHQFFPLYLRGSSYTPWAFFLAGLNMFITSIFTIFTMIPVALQRYDISTKLSIAYLTGSNILIWLLVRSGFGLEGILSAQIVSNLAVSLAYYYYSKKILPLAALKFAWVQEEVVKCYKYGIYIFLSNVGLSSFNQLDRLIIPAYLGASSLTYYSLPGNVASKVSGFVGSITNMFFPMASNFSSKGELDVLRIVYVRSARFVTVIAAGLCMTIVVFAYKILYFWISKDIADHASKLLVILSATFYLIALVSPVTNFLYGMGRAKFLAVSSLIMAGINIVLLIILLPKLQIEGAAWAYLGSAFYSVVIIYYMEKKILLLSGRLKNYLLLYLKVGIVSLLYYFLVKSLILPLSTNLIWLIVYGSVCPLMFFVLYWVFGFFEKEDQDLIKNFVLFSFQRLFGSVK